MKEEEDQEEEMEEEEQEGHPIQGAELTQHYNTNIHAHLNKNICTYQPS